MAAPLNRARAPVSILAMRLAPDTPAAVAICPHARAVEVFGFLGVFFCFFVF